MDNVESFREFLLGHFPTLKLPKGKKYVEFPVYKGILVCCMVKKDGVNVYLYSGGRVPAKEIFDKLNSLGVSGKVLNDKYTITPMPGSRNPNVVRIDLLIPYGGRDLDNDDLRKEVLDVYIQLIDLCMPLNPDAVFHKTPYEKDGKKSEKVESNKKNSLQSEQENADIPVQKQKGESISIRLEGFGQRNELFDISKASIDSENEHNSDYWYDDFSENHAYSDCDEVLSYSLPFYNDNLNIFIEGVGISKKIGNESLDEILDLDNTYTKENNDKYESGVGSENTPLILFQFRTKGIYHFESLELPAGEEFDLNRLGVNILKPVVPFEEVEEKGIRKKKWQYMVKGFVYTFLDGTKKHLDFDSGDYKETPLNPNIGTWFQIAETYDDWLSEEEQVIKFFKQFEYKGNEVAEDILEQNEGEIDDILKNSRCPEGLLEALYDGFIEYYAKDKDNSDIDWSLRKIIENPNASKSLLTKVFRYKENNQLEDDDWIVMYYRDLASDICSYLGDKDWAIKPYKKAEELAEDCPDYRNLANSILNDENLGDKDWSIKLYKKAEELAEDCPDYRNLAESISKDENLGDKDWSIKLYKKAEELAEDCPTYRNLAESISKDENLGDKDWAIKLYKKAEETMGSNIYDFAELASSVSDKDGLNDQKWSKELFQKGLILFCSNDYKEHPNVKEYDWDNEFGMLSGDINNVPIPNLKKWQDTIDAISDKLENGASRQDAVIDYLDDEHKEQINHAERESELELKKHYEKKSGSLKIVIEGRMHQFKLGILQDELREGLEEVIKYLDDYDTVENLIGALWYGKPSEIFEPIPKESWDQIASEYPVIEKIQGTSMGGVWDEFWIFYEPWVIDNDNQISIYLNDEILVSGEVGSLFEKTCDPGYKRDDVKEILGIDLTPQEVMGKINCKVSHPFKWDEEIAETIGDKEEFGSDHTFDLSKYGWHLNYIDHSVFKQKIKEVEYGTNRMQVTEYGKYKIVSDEIDLENFDWQRLVFLRNSTIWDFVPNQKEYALSHVLYAFEDGELEELFFTIHDFSILDVSCNYTWPTDE